MKTSNMPKDDSGSSVPVLCPRIASSVALTTTTATSTADFTYRAITVTATADCSFMLGDSRIIATTSGHFLPAGIPWTISVGDATRIAAIVASGTGTLYISEMG